MAVMWAQWRGRRGGDEAGPPLAWGEEEKRILATLDHVLASHRTYLNAPAQDGRMLRLRKTGGRLTTFEIDRGRAAMAREHFREAGVEKLVTVVEGDAHETLARVKGPIDFVFLDADKDGYTSYLTRLLPLVKPGGPIVAHNIGSAPDYLRSVTANADLDTVLYREGAGMSITLKKR